MNMQMMIMMTTTMIHCMSVMLVFSIMKFPDRKFPT